MARTEARAGGTGASARAGRGGRWGGNAGCESRSESAALAREQAGPVAGTGLVTLAGSAARRDQPPLSPLPRQVMSGFQSLNVPSGLPCQIQAWRS